ncbi:transcription repressor OFP6-like [Diospyros lotus]|uniref:transcription repressor OFP6-like n=1 Tax=Diospyros lotus TaxID=55363 RepID=UPI002256BCF7|nr:transcription repressor OFP6-like [Diospyros lotus]
MSSNRRKLGLNTVAVDLGCSCRRPKLGSIFNPKTPTSSRRFLLRRSSSSSSKHGSTHFSSDESATTGTLFSSASDTPPCYSDSELELKGLRAVQGFGRIGGESLAVEKDSDDPYLDFRRSMLQMIVEKEIYSKAELQELLNCFLQLNSPYYHPTIVRAFTEIWNAVFSVGRSKSRAL